MIPKCPQCQSAIFTFWQSDPFEIDLANSKQYESGCESQTEIQCRNCGYQVDANDDFELWEAVVAIHNKAPEIGVEIQKQLAEK